MSRQRDFLRQKYRAEGYYSGGFIVERTTLGETVETHGRQSPREAVPKFPTDAVGSDSLFLTSGEDDFPTPGGTRAWVV